MSAFLGVVRRPARTPFPFLLSCWFGAWLGPGAVAHSTTFVESKESKAVRTSSTTTTSSDAPPTQRAKRTDTVGELRDVMPGLGWGASPSGAEYTTPLCFQEDSGELTDIIVSPIREPVERQQTLYSDNQQLNIALERPNMGVSGDALQAAVASLLLSSSGQLKRGHELLHVQYYVPVTRYSMGDTYGSCQTAPIQELIRASEDNSMKGTNMTQLLDNFLHVYGTQVVHSVRLGGQLNLFHLKKTDAANADFSWESETASMMSAVSYITVLGGLWKAEESKDNMTSTSMMEAVNLWLESIYEGKQLAVLAQETTPMHMLLPASYTSLRKDLIGRASVVERFWRDSVGVAAKLTFLGELLVTQRQAYAGLRQGGQAQSDALGASVDVLRRYCKQCDDHASLYNTGFVSVHTMPPAMCKRLCYEHRLWVCKVVWKEQSHLPHLQDSFVGVKTAIGLSPQRRKTFAAARQLCSDDEAFWQMAAKSGEAFSGGSSAGSLLERDGKTQDTDAAGFGVASNAGPAGKPSAMPGLGWAVPPITDHHTAPLCNEPGHSDIVNAVQTVPSENIRPSVQRYRSDKELHFSLAQGLSLGIPGDATTAAVSSVVSSLLAGSNGHIQTGYELVHIQYYVPVKVQTIIDPARTCKTRHVTDLIEKFNNGTLEDTDIDRFLLSRGTRLANSVVMGGLLELFSLQKSGEADLHMLQGSLSAQGALSHQNLRVRVLGGAWPRDTNYSMQDALQRWVQSVQASSNVSVLGQTTIPIATLMPPAMHSRWQTRVDIITKGWMSTVAVSELAVFLRHRLNVEVSLFNSATMQVHRVKSFATIVTSLREYCDVSEARGITYNTGFAGMIGLTMSPASFTEHCHKLTLWTCEVALPLVKNPPRDSIVWSLTHPREAVLVSTGWALNEAETLCKSASKPDGLQVL